MKAKKSIGSQGMAELPVAYQMGLQCPMGQEIELLLGLDKWWPDLPQRKEANKELLRGLSDRVLGLATDKAAAPI